MFKGSGIIVLCIIILSGSLIPFLFTVSMVGYLLAILLYLFIYAFKYNSTVSSSAFIYYLILSLFLLTTAVLNLDIESSGTYFGVIIRLTIGLLVCSTITPMRFFCIYGNYFYYYAILSLIFYGFGVLFPDYILTLPITYNDAGTAYRHLFIYFYQGVDTWNYRNAGLFWEGGAYSAFLFFALLSSLHFRFAAKKIFILLLAIFTSGSTTGIAASVLILLASNRLLVRHKLYFVAYLIAIIPFFWDIVDNIFIAKFAEENISYLDRTVGVAADLMIFLANPAFGSGFSKYNENFYGIANSLGAFAPTSSNSFSGILAVFGMLYAILIFSPIMALFYKFGHSKICSILYIIAVVLIYSSQGLINFPLTYVFLYYGIYFIIHKGMLYTTIRNMFA